MKKINIKEILLLIVFAISTVPILIWSFFWKKPKKKSKEDILREEFEQRYQDLIKRVNKLDNKYLSSEDMND